jgi:predicted ATPase/DNA-binding SARP family transcriptional activator
LGRLEALDGSRDVTPRRPKQRALLALLLLRAGEVVTVDEAVDALWGERPVEAARNAVQGHIAALRKLVGRDRIETRGQGYVLQLDEDELDLHRFERLVTDARGLEPREKAETLARALELIRGAPLGDLRYESFARAEAARIEDLRLVTIEERIEADLELGRYEHLVSELERLVAEEPLRERLRGELMVALYRSGRQADALEAYRRGRELLVSELGIDPGPALQRLERQILNQDPQLETPVAGEQPRAVLPTPPTPLLGRERELADMRELLLRGDVRLVTLTGTAGTGKTRLALEVARGTLPDFPRGTYFVPLAPLADAPLVLPTIAQAVGVTETAAVPLAQALAARLAGGRTLLLVDNFEHVIAAAPVLAKLLAAAPALKLLVTSREALRIEGEHLYRVGALDPAAAATLFLDRAQAVRPDLDRDEEAVRAVPEICRRLDHLPLAIELAAARTNLFSPPALLARLGERLRLLTGGPRDHPERQQTLRRTLAWSYDLLTPEERLLFARLAIFAGGWTLEAADAVCGDGLDVVDGLSSLIDKSLVQVDAAEAEPRPTMLETIREYALERLEESGEAEEVGRRHAEYVLVLAEEVEPHLREGRTGPWLDRLEREQDNLRAALDRLDILGESELGLKLLGAMWRYWLWRGGVPEGRRRLERALAADDRPTPARARALNGAALLAYASGDSATARLLAHEAFTLNRRLGDAWGAALSEQFLGYAVAEMGDLERAQQIFERNLRAFRELGDETYTLSATRLLACTCGRLGDRDRARVLHEENLQRARALSNERTEALTLGELAQYALDDGLVQDALPMLEQSIRIWHALRDRGGIANDLVGYSRAHALGGDAATAARLLASADALREETGVRLRVALSKTNEETLTMIRARLDEPAFTDAWEQGRALALDEAFALALATPARAPRLEAKPAG